MISCACVEQEISFMIHNPKSFWICNHISQSIAVLLNYSSTFVLTNTTHVLLTYFSFLLGGGYNINSHWDLLTLKLRRDILNFTTDVSQKWGFADSPLPPLSAKIRNRLTPLTLLVRNNIWMHSILFLKKSLLNKSAHWADLVW